MITLQPITDPQKLEEYFRFRYQVFSGSSLKAFVQGCSDGMDKDAFDDRALHFGWYVDDPTTGESKLAGCARLVAPDASDTPIPMLAYITDANARSSIEAFIAERGSRGERMFQSSRFSLAPEYRGLRNAKDLVLAALCAGYRLGAQHALFDCDVAHVRFYGRMGFSVVPHCEAIAKPDLDHRTCVMQYHCPEVLARVPELAALLGQGKAA